MLLVITGAGASYDLVDYGTPLGVNKLAAFRPPLANELFDGREAFADALRNYPAVNAVAHALKDAVARGNTSLERELERLQAESQTYPARARHIAAVKFYLRDVITWCASGTHELSAGMTNYVRLADAIGRWQASSGEPVRFVNFNYDELLERALSDVLGFRRSKVDDYVSADDVRVYKLHGSTNWGRRLVEERYNVEGVEKEMIDGVSDFGITSDFVVTAGAGGTPEGDGAWATYPAISIPVVSKDQGSFECPAHHLDLLKADLPHVTKVLVVGWAGAEGHFLELMAAAKPDWNDVRIDFVNGKAEFGMACSSNLVHGGVKGFSFQPWTTFSEFASGPWIDALLNGDRARTTHPKVARTAHM